MVLKVTSDSPSNLSHQSPSSEPDPLTQLFLDYIRPRGSDSDKTVKSAANLSKKTASTASNISLATRSAKTMVRRGTGQQKVVQIPGLSSVLDIIIGGITAREAQENLEDATDATQKTEARLTLVQGLGLTLHGMVMAVYRPLTYYCLAEQENSKLPGVPAKLQKSQFILGLSGAGLTAFLGSIGLTISGMHLHETVSFLWTLTPEKIQTMCDVKVDSTFKDAEKEAINAVRKYLERTHLQAHGKRKKFSDAACEKFITNKLDVSILPNIIEGDPVKKLGIFIHFEKSKNAAEAKLLRCVGKEIYNKIAGRSVTEADMAEIKSAVWNQVFKHAGLSVLNMLGIFAAAALVATAFVVCSPLLLTATMIHIVLGGIGIVLEGMELVNLWGSESKPGILDKVLAHSNLWLGVGCIAAITMLSAASMGTAPVALALGIGIAWTTIALVNVCMTHYKEWQYKQKHLTQEELENKIKELSSKIAHMGTGNLLEKDQIPLANVADKLRTAILDGSLTIEAKNSLSQRVVAPVNKNQLDELTTVFDEWKKQEALMKESIQKSLGELEEEKTPEASRFAEFYRWMFGMPKESVAT